MNISFDPAKRARTLAERGLDFADAAEVFAGVTAEAEDTREDYGETRIICFGFCVAASSKSFTHRVARIATSLV